MGLRCCHQSKSICWNPPSQLGPLCAAQLCSELVALNPAACGAQSYASVCENHSIGGIPFVCNFHIDVVSCFRTCCSLLL